MKQSPLFLFYISSILSSWGDRIWFFALSIYFVTINDESLFMTAVNGLVCNIASIIMGPLVGSLIDKHQRINVIKISLLVQNLTVAINCGLVVVILLFKAEFKPMWNNTFLYFIQSILILLNVISNLASMATKISIHKDWIVVIAKSMHTNELGSNGAQNNETTKTTTTFKTKLASLNATMRRIDLITAIISPLVAGLIMSFFNLSAAFSGVVLSAIFFAVWNLASFAIEYNLLATVYRHVPELVKPAVDRTTTTTSFAKLNPFKTILDGWSLYIHQGIVLVPSVAFSFLFLTVLSFDSITIGYAKSQKVTEAFISALQGLGSVCGVLGTVAFPLLHNRLGLRLPFVGLVGSLHQFVFLAVCVVAVWLPGSPFRLAHSLLDTNKNTCVVNETLVLLPNVTIIEMHANATDTLSHRWQRVFFESACREYTSVVVLLVGMAVSRFGLWLTDLTINQIIQESVDERERGVIGGVQNSLNQMFDLLKYVAVLFLSDVDMYGFLVFMSATAIFAAICLYLAYVFMVTVGQKKQVVDDKKSGVPAGELVAETALLNANKDADVKGLELTAENEDA